MTSKSGATDERRVRETKTNSEDHSNNLSSK